MDTIRFLILHVTARFGNALPSSSSVSCYPTQSVSTYDTLDTRESYCRDTIGVVQSPMDLFKGILVQVISNGQILESYDDPDTNDDEDPYQRQRYIEAVNGATFAVKVLITDQFDFCHISRNDGIAVEFSVDGFDWGEGYYYTREDLEECFQKGEPCTYRFNDFTHFSEKTGRWMKSEYSFSALKLSLWDQSRLLTQKPNQRPQMNRRVLIHCQLKCRILGRLRSVFKESDSGLLSLSGRR